MRGMAASAAVLVAFAALSTGAAAAGEAGPAAQIPRLAVDTLDGGTRSFFEAQEGTVLFFFFEPRSAAAVLEMTFLNRLYPRLAGKGMEIVAVEASGLSREEVRKAMEDYARLFPRPSFPVVPDPEYRLSRLFRVEEVPATYVAGPDGRILSAVGGFSRERQADLTRRIVAALSEGEEGALDEAGLDAGDEGEAPPAEALEMVEVGDTIPPIGAVDLGGNIIEPGWSSGDAKVHIVFFWGAMCLPCMREMTYLEEIYRAAGHRGLRILAVQAGGQSPERTAVLMKRYARLYPMPTFPILPDSEGKIRRLFGVKEGGPATFFLDRRGKVLFATDEFPQGYEETLAAKIDFALSLGEGGAAGPGGGAAADPSSVDLSGGVHGRRNEIYEENIARGDFYYGTWKYGEALPFYLRALAAKPDSVHAAARVASIYEIEGHLAAALQQWQKVLDMEGGHAEALEHVRSLREKIP